jgi:hypothetical protein
MDRKLAWASSRGGTVVVAQRTTDSFPSSAPNLTVQSRPTADDEDVRETALPFNHGMAKQYGCMRAL